MDDALPEKTKERKTHAQVAEEYKGGAQVFIPKAKAKKTKYPKSYDPENPG